MTKRLNAFLHYLIKQLLISSTAFSAQMTEDEEIVFRVFEYGFGHAYKNRTYEDGSETIIFPRPCIIYLDEGKKDKIPDEYTLVLKFENQGEFFYKVPVFKLQNLVMNDIISNIEKNMEVGNISSTDAMDLKALTSMLYMRIYSKYQEMEEFTMRLYDQSLELPSDKYEKTVEELEEENTQLKTELSEMKNLIHDLQQQIKTFQEDNS